MALPPGILREKFALERLPTEEEEPRNEVGERVATDWVEVAEFFGSYEQQAYIEQEQRGKVGGAVQALVRTHYRSDVVGGMRLRWITRGDRLLYVSSVLERGNRQELELTVEEQVA
jgi:head-tail adaptor